MPGLFKGDIKDFEVPTPRLGRRQLKAAAAPAIPLKDLAKEAPAPRSTGNFQDLESLLDQLGTPPVFELGNPLPQERFMPKRRVGDCHASHNRFLLDDSD